MSDDPYAALIPQTDNPYAALVPKDAKATLPYPAIPMPLRDVARSIMSVPVDMARLTGFVTESPVSRWGNEANDWLDANIAPEAKFSKEPGRALLQLGGSALVPVPATGLAAKLISKAPTALKGVTAGVARAAELALPGSAPYTLSNVALNAGVGIAAGALTEGLYDAAYPEKVTPDRPVPTLNADLSPKITEPAAMDDPYAALAPEVQGNSTAKFIVDKLPYALLALGAVSVGAAARAGHRAGKLADTANVNGLTQPGTPDTQVPKAGIGEGLEAGIFNDQVLVNNRINDAVKQQVITPERGAELSSLFALKAREAINNDSTAEFMYTGKLDDNHATLAPRLWMEEAARLTPDQRTLLNNLLPAADELDVRTENVRQGKFDRKTGEPERVMLYDKTYSELQKAVNDGRADPMIVKLEQEYRNVNNTLLNYMVSKGVISAEEAADMRAKGPHYMHRVVEEMTIERNRGAGMPLTQGTGSNSPLTRRQRTEEAGPLRSQDPAFALEDGVRQTLDFVNRNEAIREIANSLSNTKTPAGVAFNGIGRILPANAAVADGYVGIKFRDKGSRLQLEVDKDIAATLMPYPRVTVPVLSNLRVIGQYFTTGPVGALLGNVQAFTSAATSAATAMVTAPSKMRMGYIDSFVRRLTNDRVNMRALGLVDPTFALQIGDAIVRDFAAHAANSLGSTLNRSIERNGYIASMIGPAKARSLANSMVNAYHNSLTHYMRREGVLSQGISYASDAKPTGSNIANIAPDYARSMPYGGNAPSITNVRSMQQFNEYMALQGSRLTPIGMRRAWHFYSRALDLLSNSPQSAMYRANAPHFKGRETELAGLARTVVGDPAQYGGYRAVQAGTSVLMYQNIAMQAAHQVFKAIQKEPIAATGRIATLGTMLSLIMLHSAITSDEDAINRGEEPRAVAHLLTRDANDAARSFRIYYGSSDPEASIRLPIDGALAPFFSAILAGFTDAFDVDNPEFFTERYAPLRESIERLLSDGDTERMKAAFGVMGLDMSTPSLAQLYSRLGLGLDTRGAMNLATGPNTSKVSDAPGFAQTSLNNDVIDKYTSTVFETMLGLGGQTLLDLARTFGYTYRVAGADKATQAMLSQYGQTLGSTGSARMAAPLLGVERKLRTNDLLGDQVRKAEEKMQTIQQGFAEVEGGAGTIGNKRDLRESPYGAGREGVPEDIKELLGATKQLFADLAPLRKERKRQSDLVKDVQSSGLLRSNPALLRSTSNEHVMNIRSTNASIYAAIDQFEKLMSAQTGRRIRIDQLDPRQGLNQFAPLR